MLNLSNSLQRISSCVNTKLKNTPPTKIIAATVAAAVAIPCLYNVWNQPWSHYIWNTSWKDHNWKKTCTTMGHEAAKKIPLLNQYIESKIEEKVDKYTIEFIRERDSVLSEDSKKPLLFNHEALSFDEILEQVPEINEMHGIDIQKVSGVYYRAEDEEEKEMEQFLDLFIAPYDHENILHPDLVPVLNKMQRDVISWHGHILSLDEPFGCLTSGGTESLLLAVKSAINWGKKRGIKKPNIVMPYSGHSAINKAKEYFGCEVRTIPLTEMGEADIKAMTRAIDDNTVMLMGSYPNYPYGTVDNIEEIARLAQDRDLLCHVDACLGGFIAAFLQDDEESGIAPFDFRIPGVTSISLDGHKYGMSRRKGVSAIIYRDKELYEEQIFADENWPGGTNVTPGIRGSTPGGNTADLWASMQFRGYNGYRQSAQNISYATRTIADRCKQELIGLIEVIGNPNICNISFKSSPDYPEDVVWKVASCMRDLGWTLSIVQYPPGFHFDITPRHAKTRDMADAFINKFMDDLLNAEDHVLNNPDMEIAGLAKAYGGVVDIPSSIVNQVLRRYTSVQTSPYPSYGEQV